MTEAEAARLNARYSAFYLTRYSPPSGRIIQVGRPRKTIQEALAAAERYDNRNRHRQSHLTFVDIEPPRSPRRSAP